MDFEGILKKWNGGILRGAQLRLSNILDIDQSNIRRWMEGVTKPRERFRPKLAKELGVTVDELMASLEKKGPIADLVEMADKKFGPVSVSYIPVLGTVSAEKFNLSFDAPPEGFLPFPNTSRGEFFALIVRGDCMTKPDGTGIKSGEAVVIKKQEWANDQDIVVARWEGEYTMKRFYKRGNIVELRPDNPKAETIKIKGNLHIVGVVVMAARKP